MQCFENRVRNRPGRVTGHRVNRFDRLDRRVNPVFNLLLFYFFDRVNRFDHRVNPGFY